MAAGDVIAYTNSSGTEVFAVDSDGAVTLGSTLAAGSVAVTDSGGFFAGSTAEAVLAAIGPFIPVAITDPGDAGAIPVTQAGDCQLTSAGAETRTLADPTMVGQILTLRCGTYVGDIVVTAASPVNATGNNTLTFGVAGDEIVLIGARDGASAYAWHVLNNDGVALSTV